MAGGTDHPRRTERGWRAVLVYTLARVALFAAVLGLLYLVGLTGPGVLLLALLASGVISYLLLARQRVAMGRVVEERIGSAGPWSPRRRFRDRVAATKAAEDAYVDGQASPDGGGPVASAAPPRPPDAQPGPPGASP